MNLKKLTRIILLVAVLLVLSIVPVNAVVFNAAFDSDFYVNCYPDLKAAFGNDANAAYNHYLTYGIKEGRIASPVFDVKTYIRNYPDLQAAFGDDYVAAYNHFLTNGMNEGRLASDSFNVQVYIANYPDLQAAFGNDVAGAYNHYLNYGMAEGRVCGALEAGADAPEDHVHDYKLTKTLITATCKDNGEGVYTCACGETKTDVIPASEEYHDYVEIPSGVENVKIFKCNICGDVKTELVKEEAHDHNYLEIEDSRIEATCTEEGKIFKQCEVCGEKLTETIAKIAHKSSTKAGQGKILTGAVSCTTDGEEEVTCDVCHQKFTRAISAHNYEKVAEVPATCTAEGVTTYKCKVCGATKADTIEKIDHDYTNAKEVIPADCQTEGLTLSVCKVCGDEKRTISKKLDHTGTATKGWVEVDEKGNYILTDKSGKFDPTAIDIKNQEADCEHDVVEAFECTTCHKIQVKVVAKKLGHRIDSTKDVVVGSVLCDEKGVPQKNSEGKYVVTKGGKADCQHAEVKLFTCANEGCKEEEVVVLSEKLDHTPKANTTVVYGATCDTEGRKTYTCATCNEQIEEKTGEKALGHNYAFEPATCTKAAAIVCTRGCTLTGSEKGYEDFKKTLSKAQTDALTANKANGHQLIGTVTKKNNKYYALCKACGEIEVIYNAENKTITTENGKGEVWNVTVSDKGVITVASKGEVKDPDTEKTPLSITSVAVAKCQLTEGGSACSHPNGSDIKANADKIEATLGADGKTITVTRKGAEDLTSYVNGSNQDKKWFGLVLTANVKATNLESVGYTFSSDETNKTAVAQWINGATDNQFILWVNAEDCATTTGKKITFTDSATKATTELTIKYSV